MDFKNRTIKEIWEHHGMALAKGDINEFILDFADDCVFINNPFGGHASGVIHGPQAVGKWCEQFFQMFEKGEDFIKAETHFEENVAVVEWEIDSKTHRVRNGVDTFIVKDGKFSIITVVYKTEVKEL